MAFPGFTPADFKVFEIDGLQAPHGGDQDAHPPQARGDRPRPPARRRRASPATRPSPTWPSTCAAPSTRPTTPGSPSRSTSAATRSTATSRWRSRAAPCASSSRPGPSTRGKKRWASSWKRQGPQARARPPPREGARRGSRTSTTRRRRRSSPTCPPTRWRGSATSSCARATARSCSGARVSAAGSGALEAARLRPRRARDLPPARAPLPLTVVRSRLPLPALGARARLRGSAGHVEARSMTSRHLRHGRCADRLRRSPSRRVARAPRRDRRGARRIPSTGA